jgi:hypothetical protein
MGMRRSFTRGLDYPSIIAASERVAWTVDSIFDGRRFDPSGSIVPSSWVGADQLAFLSDRDQLVLNHCRAFSYVHLLGNFEEFAPVHLADVVQQNRHADRAQLRALVRFADEELKHQQLFLRAERVLEESCGHAFARYFDPEKTTVAELTTAMFEHWSLPIFLMVLALEWGTQRHYVESVRDLSSGNVDPLYVDLLKAHWLEEAQHIKCDRLEIARLADEVDSTELARVFDDVLALGALVDVAFAGQAECEIDTLEAVRGRSFTDVELRTLHMTLRRSLSGILAGVGLGHPSFVQVARELSPEGAANLGIGSR